jgi:PAS domain S-box-containing protein
MDEALCFSAFFDKDSEAVAVCRQTDTFIVYVNQAMQAVGGWGQGWLSRPEDLCARIHPEQQHGETASILLHLHTGESLQSTFRMISASGKVEWFALSIYSLDCSNGSYRLIRLRSIDALKKREEDSGKLLEQLVSLNENLSNHQEELSVSMEELRIANQQMEQSRNETASIINSASEAIFTLAASGQLLNINKAGLHLFGLKPHLVPYLYIVNLVARSFRKEVTAYLMQNVHTHHSFSYKDYAEGASFQTELLMLRADKTTEFPAKLSISRVESTAGLYFVAVVTDLSEIREAQKGLLQKQMLIERIADTIPDLVFVYDIDLQRFVFSNRYRFEGFAPGAITSRIGRLLENATREPGLQQERFSVNDNTRATRWFMLRYTPFNAEGTSQQWFGLLHDITETYEYEQRLMNARSEAEKAATARAQFLANMSHEIRTPMNAVIGMANLLANDRLTKAQQKKVNVLRFSADHLMAVLNDILDLTRLDAGEVKPECIAFNLSELLENIYMQFLPRAKERGLHFKIQIPEQIPLHLMGDPHRLVQIIGNLLSNAVKFTHQGCIMLAVYQLHTLPEMVRLRFEVEDTGIGIAPEKHELIFERFVQANPETSRQYGGTGLGLAIVQSLLRLLDSQIYIDSELGKGARFWFDIDFRTVQAKQITPLKMSLTAFTGAEPSLKGCSILSAEDNAMNQWVLRQFLEQWGASISFVRNGHEVLKRIRKKRYDLIIMDLHMPEMDGFQTVMELRKSRSAYRRAVPVLALTADTDSRIAEAVKNAGMQACITKPFEPAHLYQTIRTLIGTGGHATPIVNIPATLLEAFVNDPKRLDSFIEMNLEALGSFEPAYREAVITSDTKLADRLVHELMPVISLLRLTDFGKFLDERKTILKKQDLKLTEAHLHGVSSWCRQATDSLKGLRSLAC